MSNTKFILKLAAILFAIVFVCSLLLALCNNLTEGRIQKLRIKEENEARVQVLSDAKEFKKVNASADVLEAYVGTDADGNTVGFCFKVAPSGFGGKITMMVGVDTDCKVTGVKITDMAETPGLGAKASEEEWISQFKSKADEISVVKTGNAKDSEINAISGATITSKAVANGVNIALKQAKALTAKEGE